MNEEWIVEVDKSDLLIGKIERNVAHDLKNLRHHREVMCLLFTDPSHVNFIMQHRSKKKNQLPGFWTLSATGHVDYTDLVENDTKGYITAAKRETMEELGVEAKNLKLIGTILQKLPMNLSTMGIVVGEYEGELSLDPEEVGEARVFNKDSLLEICDKLTPGAKACLEYLGLINL